MFPSLGMPELLVILTLALIIFGPRKLPELGRSLGKSLGEFKRASNELRNTLDEEIRIEEERSTAQKAAVPVPPPRPADDGVTDEFGAESPGSHEQPVPRDSGTA
jgi:sec-independent protein translocase protein TatA